MKFEIYKKFVKNFNCQRNRSACSVMFCNDVWENFKGLNKIEKKFKQIDFYMSKNRQDADRSASASSIKAFFIRAYYLLLILTNENYLISIKKIIKGLLTIIIQYRVCALSEF